MNLEHVSKLEDCLHYTLVIVKWITETRIENPQTKLLWNFKTGS